MGNLASTQLSTQSDPALVQRQILADREKQLASIANPQQQLAARLGGLLGGGLVNVAQDRGFFDINDPLLNRVTQIQGIYNEVASRVDPTADPARFYSELQSAYSNAGLGREALAAAQEAQKAKGSALDLQIKETAFLEKNPELIAGKIEDALKKGNDPEAMRLANLSTRLQEDRDLTLEGKRVNILKDKAYIRYQDSLTEGGKYTVQLANPNIPELGWIRFDMKNPKASAQVIPLPTELQDKLSTITSKNKDAKGSKLSQEQVNALVNPQANTSGVSQAGASAGSTPTIVPNTNYQTTPTIPYDSTTKTYDLNKNPTISNLLIARNSQTNPAAVESINQAIQTQLAQLMQQYPGVQFVGGQ